MFTSKQNCNDPVSLTVTISVIVLPSFDNHVSYATQTWCKSNCNVNNYKLYVVVLQHCKHYIHKWLHHMVIQTKFYKHKWLPYGRDITGWLFQKDVNNIKHEVYCRCHVGQAVDSRMHDANENTFQMKSCRS